MLPFQACAGVPSHPFHYRIYWRSPRHSEGGKAYLFVAIAPVAVTHILAKGEAISRSGEPRFGRFVPFGFVPFRRGVAQGCETLLALAKSDRHPTASIPLRLTSLHYILTAPCSFVGGGVVAPCGNRAATLPPPHSSLAGENSLIDKAIALKAASTSSQLRSFRRLSASSTYSASFRRCLAFKVCRDQERRVVRWVAIQPFLFSVVVVLVVLPGGLCCQVGRCCWCFDSGS